MTASLRAPDATQPLGAPATGAAVTTSATPMAPARPGEAARPQAALNAVLQLPLAQTGAPTPAGNAPAPVLVIQVCRARALGRTKVEAVAEVHLDGLAAMDAGSAAPTAAATDRDGGGSIYERYSRDAWPWPALFERGTWLALRPPESPSQQQPGVPAWGFAYLSLAVLPPTEDEVRAVATRTL